MADASKKEKQDQSQRTKAQKSTQSATPARFGGRPSRRTLSKRRLEERRQFLALLVVGGAIGLSVLILLIGVIYDQLWYPSRPLAQVGDETLTRREYWQEGRYALAQEVVQNVQLQSLFGDNPQIGGQLAGRVPLLNQQVALIRDTPQNEQIVANWENYQLTLQGAEEMGITTNADAVNQQIAQNLGTAFLPTPPVTPTTELTPTALTDTGAITPTVAGEETPEADTTDVVSPTLEPTATIGPTETPAPTETPEPTPEVAVANEQVPTIIDAIMEQYSVETELSGQDPQFTEENFRTALERQFRQQLLTEQVQEDLVAEGGFETSTEPDRVQARHILVAADPPEDATEEVIEETFAEAEERADELVEELQDGADFAELASEESDDPGSQENGGDVGFFDREGFSDAGGTYVPAFVETAFSLEGDEISDPVRTEFGWHIIQVTDRQTPTEDEQLQTARAEAFDEWLTEQRETLDVRRFPEPTATAEIPAEEVLPTEEPVFLPGPPTAVPIPTEAPIAAPTEDTENEEAPTAEPDAEDTDGDAGPPVPTAEE